MAAVEIIDAVVVLDGRMAASGAVAMGMLIALLVIAHRVILFLTGLSSPTVFRL
jgi:hypothetical protein